MLGFSAHVIRWERGAAAAPLSRMLPDLGTTGPRGTGSAGTGQRFPWLLEVGGRAQFGSAVLPSPARLHNAHMHRHGVPQALQTGSGCR